MTKEESELYAKVQKLFKFAEDGRGNEQEMQIALEKAQQLVRQYHLDEAKARNYGKVEGIPSTGDMVFVANDWQFFILATIAHNNFGVALKTEFEVMAFIVGSEIDIKIIHYLYDTVIAQTKTLFQKSSEHFERILPLLRDVDPDQERRKFENGYYLGIVQAIEDRLGGNNEANSNALVMSRQKENQDFIDSMGGSELRPVTNPEYSGLGFLMGKNDGDEISMNRGIETEKQKKLK